MANKSKKRVPRVVALETAYCDLYMLVEHVFARLPEGDTLLESSLYEQARGSYKNICHERYEDLRMERAAAIGEVDGTEP